ncbi:hypothetical protein AMS68_003126 [Peltaster fructicola]|uniref:Uncharacterized protein n=1 Tax=Peltaster fructicola TaxID=286661 RepID=A0A6H0XSL2_9PEZI|nr:hypothetical protein AMS68_003126 [Peltaster fructicola]
MACISGGSVSEVRIARLSVQSILDLVVEVYTEILARESRETFDSGVETLHIMTRWVIDLQQRQVVSPTTPIAITALFEICCLDLVDTSVLAYLSNFETS